MTRTELTRRSAALLMLASVAACGGGGGSGDDAGTGNPGGGTPGGGDSGSSDPGSGGNPGGGSGAVTGTYRLQAGASSNAQGLADANRMGAEGYALVTSLANTVGTSVTIGDYYMSDTAHTGHKLTYALQPDEATLAGFLDQLNRQGANGYALKSSVVSSADFQDVQNLYVKNTSRSDQFSYEALTTDLQTPQAMADELNRQGSRGFRFIGPMIVGSTMFTLYVRRSDGVTYQYTVEAESNAYTAADRAGLQAVLDAKGAGGWLIRGTEAKGPVQAPSFMNIYEKSSAQSGAIEYAVEATSNNASLQDLLGSMNSNAAKGFFWLSQDITGDGKINTISVKNGGTLLHPLSGVSFP